MLIGLIGLAQCSWNGLRVFNKQWFLFITLSPAGVCIVTPQVPNLFIHFHLTLYFPIIPHVQKPISRRGARGYYTATAMSDAWLDANNAALCIDVKFEINAASRSVHYSWILDRKRGTVLYVYIGLARSAIIQKTTYQWLIRSLNRKP